MLVVAVFTVIVGERLARREVEERIPADREKLLDFSAALKGELDRLDSLYLNHLNYLVANYYPDERDTIQEDAEEVAAVKSMHLFSEENRIRRFEILGSTQAAPLPDVSIEGQRAPLGLSQAVIIPAKLMERSRMKESGWITAPGGKHLVYWSRPDLTHIVAVVINRDELNREVFRYLENWMDVPLAPLRESESDFLIESPSGGVIDDRKQEEQGALAFVIPLRTHFGEWQIQTWDGVSKKSYHDPFTMTMASLLAVVFLLSGILLYHHQRRSLKLARQRVSFVNQVSHELGSPLTNVTLNLDLAVEALGEGSPDAKYRLELISQEVERLNRLVANVLTFSQCDRGALEIHMEPCFPDEVISSLLDLYRPALVRRGVKVEFEAGVNARVETDPDALAQIVANLISNVEKYAYSGKWLGIKTFLRDENLVVSVMDHGPGIPEGAKERIFKSFERVESRVNEGSSGAGLGLAIASELAKKLDGDLCLLDSDEGCHFELTVPSHIICSVVEKNAFVV